MAKTTLKNLYQIKQQHKGKKIVFCSGSFDLTHAGHLLFFEDCKKLGDILVVMIGGDKAIRRGKGNERPILNEHLRIRMIDALKPVDYTLIDEIDPVDIHPLHAVDRALEALRPDVYVINQDASDIPYRENLAQKYGVELVILERTCPEEFEEVSTTKIIEKIKKT